MENDIGYWDLQNLEEMVLKLAKLMLENCPEQSDKIERIIELYHLSKG